jgi:hypothetical protein
MTCRMMIDSEKMCLLAGMAGHLYCSWVGTDNTVRGFGQKSKDKYLEF